MIRIILIDPAKDSVNAPRLHQLMDEFVVALPLGSVSKENLLPFKKVLNN